MSVDEIMELSRWIAAKHDAPENGRDFFRDRYLRIWRGYEVRSLLEPEIALYLLESGLARHKEFMSAVNREWLRCREIKLAIAVAWATAEGWKP